MIILFTDNQEYDDDNSSENITIQAIGTIPYKETILTSIIYNENIKYIKIIDKDTNNTKAIYPISQILKIIP